MKSISSRSSMSRRYTNDATKTLKVRLLIASQLLYR
jgi:hypothetical protein